MKSWCATIHVKATEQYFFNIMLCKVVLTLILCMKSYGVTIQMKATVQYFPVVLFIMLYKLVLTFESVELLHSAIYFLRISQKQI